MCFDALREREREALGSSGSPRAHTAADLRDAAAGEHEAAGRTDELLERRKLERTECAHRDLDVHIQSG